MTNHPNRSKLALDSHGYVIQLASGRLWRDHRASDAAIFSSLENAQKTMAGFSCRGALANPKILRLTSGPSEGAVKCDGYWTIEI